MTDSMISEQIPPLVVDRSPELMRGAREIAGAPVLRAVCLYPDEVRGILEESEPGDGATCVLASFLRRQLPGCEPHIEGEHPYIDYNGRRLGLAIGPGVVEQIGRYDRGEPGAFADGFRLIFQGE